MAKPKNRVRLALRVYGEDMSVEGDLPARPIRLDELLPILRIADDAIIGRAITRVESTGAKVSCRQGCTACCRVPPVPITPPEAFAIARSVDAMPEPRRTEVRAAFAERVAQLRAARLYETYLERDPNLSREQARDVGEQYIALRLACPFLLADACSIYQDRPFVCRQYLVTSPAELCEDPLNNPVKPVPIPARFATAVLNATESTLGPPQYTIPLVLALDYVARHGDQLARTFNAKDLFGRVTAELAKG